MCRRWRAIQRRGGPHLRGPSPTLGSSDDRFIGGRGFGFPAIRLVPALPITPSHRARERPRREPIAQTLWSFAPCSITSSTASSIATPASPGRPKLAQVPAMITNWPWGRRRQPLEVSMRRHHHQDLLGERHIHVTRLGDGHAGQHQVQGPAVQVEGVPGGDDKASPPAWHPEFHHVLQEPWERCLARSGREGRQGGVTTAPEEIHPPESLRGA